MTTKRTTITTKFISIIIILSLFINACGKSPVRKPYPDKQHTAGSGHVSLVNSPPSDKTDAEKKAVEERAEREKKKAKEKQRKEAEEIEAQRREIIQAIQQRDLYYELDDARQQYPELDRELQKQLEDELMQQEREKDPDLDQALNKYTKWQYN